MGTESSTPEHRAAAITKSQAMATVVCEQSSNALEALLTAAGIYLVVERQQGVQETRQVFERVLETARERSRLKK